MKIIIKYIFCVASIILLFSTVNSVALSIPDEAMGKVNKYAEYAFKIKQVPDALQKDGRADDTSLALYAMGEAFSIRSQKIRRNLTKNYQDLDDLNALERQITKLAEKYKVPSKYAEIIRVSSNGNVVKIREVLDNNIKNTLSRIDKETEMIVKLEGKASQLKIAGEILGKAADVFDIYVNFSDVVQRQERDLLEDSKNVLSVSADVLPWARAAASGPLLAAQIGSYLYETSMNYYMDKMRDLGEERLKLIRDAESVFRDTVQFIIDDEILHSKGKTKLNVEENMRRRIASEALKLSARFDYDGSGDLYNIVFGKCANYIFCAEAAMDKLTGGAMTENFRNLQNIVIGLNQPNNPALIKHLQDRQIPGKIESVLQFYAAYDEIMKEFELMLNKISSDQQLNPVNLPIIKSLPPATSISLISSEKEIIAGTENQVYFTANTNSNSDSVIVTASKNGIKDLEIDLASAGGEKWTSAMTAFKTPGNYTLIASARDKSGKITCSSSPITITVKSAAFVKSIRSSVDSVVLGGSVEFTASVQGVVGSNAQVILKLDSYEPTMQFSGNTWKISVPITDVNADGKRTYTAYIKENGISGEVLPVKILNVTSPVKIDSVEAKMFGQPIVSCALNDEVDFFAKISGGVVPDKVFLKLDSHTRQMTQSSPGLWWVRVPIEQTNGGIRTYSVYTEKNGFTSNYATPKNLAVKLSNAVLTVEAQDNNGKSVDTVNLNDHVHFIVNVDGTANGLIKVKVGGWTIPQELVRQGTTKKWKTSDSVPMQQVEPKPYYAFIEVNGQEAAKSPTQQIVVSRANGLQCPSVAKTGDFINAELLVDNTITSVKTTSKIKGTPCSGNATETKLQFEKAGYGWVWPGTTVDSNNCGTLEFIADTKTGTALKTYTCTTRVNMDSQPSPAPTPAPQSQAIESYTSTEPLGGGFLKLKTKVLKKRDLGVLMVRAVFPDGGIETESRSYANELVVMQLHQEGVDEWAVRLKYPGQRVVPFTIEFWIDGRRIGYDPGTFYPLAKVPEKEPYADIQCETSLNGTNMSITCYYTDKYYSSRGLEGRCTSYNPDGTGSHKIFKLQQNVKQSVLLAPGKVVCDVYHDDATVKVEHSHFEYFIAGGSSETVNKLYQSFQEAYNSKNESKIMALISDEWESTGDGTTASDLSVNLRNSFRIFDQIGCTISNLQITQSSSGKYVARYDITIKGTIFKGNIRHEEKSSVSEEVTIDDSGKARITKTLNGRFWSVQ